RLPHPPPLQRRSSDLDGIDLQPIEPIEQVVADLAATEPDHQDLGRPGVDEVTRHHRSRVVQIQTAWIAAIPARLDVMHAIDNERSEEHTSELQSRENI